MNLTEWTLLLYRYRPILVGVITALIAAAIQIASWISENGLSFFGRCSGERSYSCTLLEWMLKTFSPFAWPGLFVLFLVSDLVIRITLKFTFRWLGVVVPKDVQQKSVRLLPVVGWAIVVLLGLSLCLGR